MRNGEEGTTTTTYRPYWLQQLPDPEPKQVYPLVPPHEASGETCLVGLEAGAEELLVLDESLVLEDSLVVEEILVLEGTTTLDETFMLEPTLEADDVPLLDTEDEDRTTLLGADDDRATLLDRLEEESPHLPNPA